jgi:hypothetical protein
MEEAVKQGADIIVRLNPFSVVLCDANGQPMILEKALKRQPPETIRTLPVLIQASGGQSAVQGWVHAYRLSAEQAGRARHKCRQRHKKGAPKAESLWLARWVLVFTTLAPAVLSAQTIMRLYRCRWQIEQFYEDAKGECGLDHYQGRRWDGLHRHLALVMLAYSCLARQRWMPANPAGFSPLWRASVVPSGPSPGAAVALPGCGVMAYRHQSNCSLSPYANLTK